MPRGLKFQNKGFEEVKQSGGQLYMYHMHIKKQAFSCWGSYFTCSYLQLMILISSKFDNRLLRWDTRKPVFSISDMVLHEPACAATKGC